MIWQEFGLDFDVSFNWLEFLEVVEIFSLLKIFYDILQILQCKRNQMRLISSHVEPRIYNVFVSTKEICISRFLVVYWLGPLLFLIYLKDMCQPENSNLYLYPDYACLLFQHRNVRKIKNQFSKDFWNIYLESIYLGEDKTRSLLFAHT